MSWTPVDSSCVRYSPVEGTHYFYDPLYPTSVQFLLSGRWETWDVGWVKHKAQDPDIRRVAAEAETHLVQNPHSGYIQWPSEPPPGPPPGPPPPAPVNGYAVPQLSEGSPLINPPPNLVPLSPSPEYAQPFDLPAPEPTNIPYPTPSSTQSISYSSPYGQQSLPNTGSGHTATATQAPRQVSPIFEAEGGPSDGNPPPQQHEHLVQAPPLQPAAPTGGVVLSRTRETKILLCIDGDGIRGLSALLLVESLVNAICVKVGQRLDSHQIFDLTGGSSLGGVIAIMLCRLRMQAHRAREAYKQIAKQVFLNKRDFYVSLDPRAPSQNVDGMALENEIKTIIQQELGNADELLLDEREDSGDVFVLSTHIEIGTNKPALMRSYQTRRITGPELDKNMPIWQAMKATSVAPRYMPPQPGVTQRLVIEPGLVDHGTAKNNPVRDMLYECRKLFRYTNDTMIIVSVGTGLGLDRDNEIAEMANGIESRQAEARVWGEKFELEHAPLMERNWMKYFRFNVPGLEDVPLEEWRCEDKVMQKTSEYLARPEVGQMFYACVDAITALLMNPHGA